MSAIPGFILILLGFGFLIFVHELGHFLAAKWAGIRADGFAIGMGPCIASYRRGVGLVLGSADAQALRKLGKRPIEMSDQELTTHGLGETEYSLRILPLGGYVRMLGQEDGNPAATSEDARSFGKATIFRRGVVILAGITANLALALVLFLIAFLVGVQFPAPKIGGVGAMSPAANARALDPGVEDGLRAGDRVVSIDGEPAQTFLDLRLAAAMAKPDTALEITVARGTDQHRFSVLPKRDPVVGLLSIGVEPARSAAITGVRASRDAVRQTMQDFAPALEKAGVGPGAAAISVNGKPISSFADLERAALESGGEPLDIEWRLEAHHGAASNTVRAPLQPVALFDRLVSVGADGRAIAEDAGIAGFSPLVRVAEVGGSSPSRGRIEKGDVILRIGSLQAPRLTELQNTLLASPNGTVPALVRRGDKDIAIELRTDASGRVGIFLEPAWDLPLLANSVVETVAESSAAPGERATTRPTPAASLAPMPLGWIESVSGTQTADFNGLRSALVAAAKAHEGDAPLTLSVTMRDPSPAAAPAKMDLVLRAEDLAALRGLGHAFPLPPGIFDPDFTVLSADGNPIKAITMGFRQTVKMVEQVFLTLDRVGRGSVGVEQLQGPVGILHTGTQVADEGFMYVLFFLALISVNLAVVNALPIPIADGGLFMFLMYEKIRGKPPSIAFQNAAAMAGIALVAGVFLLTFYNDLMRLFA